MFTAARLAEAGCAVVASATKLAAGAGRFKESLGLRRISSPACRLLGEDRTSLKLVLTSESDPEPTSLRRGSNVMYGAIAAD
jgi:hypothetical protein